MRSYKWLTALDDGGSVQALFVDFRKAFVSQKGVFGFSIDWPMHSDELH